jgi:hypothetical protein
MHFDECSELSLAYSQEMEQMHLESHIHHHICEISISKSTHIFFKLEGVRALITKNIKKRKGTKLLLHFFF